MDELELKRALGKNIKRFRFRRGLSQAALAEKAGISVTFLSNLERGNNYPKPGTLCGLASALDARVWELFRGAADGDDPGPSLADRVCEDFVRHVNLAMEAVRSQYKP